MNTLKRCVSKTTSCSGCLLYRESKCYWFQPAKVIPQEVMKKGCKLREPKIKEIYENETIAYLIDKFDGEFI